MFNWFKKKVNLTERAIEQAEYWMAECKKEEALKNHYKRMVENNQKKAINEILAKDGNNNI